MTERSANNALWVPIAAGIVGAGLALLFAPRSGRETRDKLRENYGELRDRADGKLAAAREKVDESVQEAKALKGRLAGAIKKDTSKSAGRTRDSYDEDSLQNNWEGEV